MSSHSSYTYTHIQNNQSSPVVATELCHLCVYIIQFTTGPPRPDGAFLLPQGSHQHHKPLKCRYLIWEDSTSQVCTTQGWKETTTRSHWNCRGTTHNIPSTAKIRPGHGANIHAFAKGAIRSVFASSTQCLETQHHTLSPKYTVTQSLL